MKSLTTLLCIAVASLLAGTGCSRAPATSPDPVLSEISYPLQFDARFTFADSGYTVHDLEYADPSGAVHKVNFHDPVWNTTMRFKSGDRLYLRAVVEYRSGLAGAIQIGGSPGFYRSDRIESLSGPETRVLMIDERLE